MPPTGRGGQGGGRGFGAPPPPSLSDFMPDSRGNRGRGGRPPPSRGRSSGSEEILKSSNGPSNTTKERGRIALFNEEKGFGFILPNAGGKRVFFHLREVEDQRILKERDEVEYVLVPDRMRPREMMAANIRLIGHVLTEKEEERKQEEDSPLPSFKPSWMSMPSATSSQPSSFPSATENKAPSASSDFPLNLAPQGGLGSLRPQVPSFSSTRKQTSRDKLVDNYDHLPKERGIIESVKDTFGFIKCPGKAEDIFYHVKEVEGGVKLQEGDEVEFILAPSTNLTFTSFGRNKGRETKAIQVRLIRSTGIFQHDVSSSLEDPLSENPEDAKNRFKTKRFALDWLKEMANLDSEQLLLHSSELENLLNQDELPFTVIQPVVALLTRPGLRKSDRSDRIYSLVVSSKFLRHPRNLKSYILRLSETKRASAEVISEFSAVVNLCVEIMDRLQTSNTDVPLEALETAAQKIPNLPDEVKNNISRMLQMRELKKTQIAQQYNVSEWTPVEEEEDFRDIAIFPSTEEIFSIESGQLSEKIRPNIVDGKYKNVMHYLDTHYRLLREDCLQPLREGIKSYIASKNGDTDEVSRDIRVYTSVMMRGIQCTRSGIVYRVSFKLDCEVAWERSKRLMYGSLLCLSCDDFKTLIWATVANRDTELLYSQQIDIRFPQGYESRFSHENVYTMVESSTTYFEAYQHVLRALQSLDIDAFPFAEHLIDCVPDVEPPNYIKPKDTYNFAAVFEGGKTSFPVLGPWPIDEIQTTMDHSQMQALQQALTRRLAIIQGPPGTGKTFCGLKIMRALLDNRQYRRSAPILVICYTNHALDQFLEGVLEFEENLVRIGGQSKSDALKERNLRKLMYESGRTGKQHIRSRHDLNQQLAQLEQSIQECIAELNRQELTFEQLKTVATPEQITSLTEGRKMKKGETIDDIIKFWLKEQVHRRRPTQQYKPKEPSPAEQKEKKSSEGDSKQTKNGKKQRNKKQKDGAKIEAEQKGDKKEEQKGDNKEKKEANGKPTQQLKSGLKVYMGDEEEEELDDELITQMQQERMVGEDETMDTHSVFELKDSVVVNRKRGVVQIEPEILKCEDLWSLTTAERHKLFKYWLVQYWKKGAEDSPLPMYCERYEQLCHQRKILEEECQVEVLATAAVIGMTTTGVAKFQRLIQQVQPEVIIVEEAAEVLEAHIIAALSPYTKHLILIGDHEQLRPSTAVYRLSIQYNLDVSLFERLVRNGLEQVTLLRQRRMRPQISALIAPIYPRLEDHDRVKEYPDVLGVYCNVFFVDHRVEEESNQDSSSKSNKHEAEFVTRLTNYLLLQGYKGNQITVLTPYSGQVFSLRKEFKKMGLTSVRITSVDNFQGEENDIMILSLVRSNKNGIIGFLNASNRICVALSRAKHGMFLIGNAQLLESRNELWKKIINILRGQKAIGSALRLQCQNHPSKFTMVSTAQDFKKVEDGGCDLYCKQQLACGHICPRFCHPYSHDQLQCTKPCLRKHETCGHGCNKRCFEECGPCEVLVEKVIPECGHKNQIPCYLPPDAYTCTQPCEKMLPCNEHKCPKMCGEKCSQYCHAITNRELKCGHVVRTECSADLWKHRCVFPCREVLECGHICIGSCSTCQQGKQHVKCAQCG